MGRVAFIWDLDDDPEGNYWHICGKYLMVVFERVSDDPLTVYPITAYEVPPPGPRKRRERR